MLERLKTIDTRSISILNIALMNPLQLKFNCKHITQSAGNQTLKRVISINFSTLSSSETTRVTSPEKNFYYWFAGLIDGAGNFYISKNNVLSCEICLRLSDIQVLYKIKQIFFGTILTRKKLNNSRWRISKQSQLEFLISKIQDKIVSKKIYEQLQKVIKLIDLKLIKTIPSTENAWFTGFMEATGDFYINNQTYNFEIKLIHKNYETLESIKVTFSVGTIYYESQSQNWILSITAITELKSLIVYFSRFKFKSKRLSINLITFERLILFKERMYHFMNSESIKKRRFEKLLKKFLQRKKI
jgi:hypothetical protein